MVTRRTRLIASAVLVAIASLVVPLGLPRVCGHPQPTPRRRPRAARPSQHPRPVILVHGTWADAQTTWKTLEPTRSRPGLLRLHDHLGKPRRGSLQNLFDLVGGDSIRNSARSLASFVDGERRQTAPARSTSSATHRGPWVAVST